MNAKNRTLNKKVQRTQHGHSTHHPSKLGSSDERGETDARREDVTSQLALCKTEKVSVEKLCKTGLRLAQRFSISSSRAQQPSMICKV